MRDEKNWSYQRNVPGEASQNDRWLYKGPGERFHSHTPGKTGLSTPLLTRKTEDAIPKKEQMTHSVSNGQSMP